MKARSVVAAVLSLGLSLLTADPVFAPDPAPIPDGPVGEAIRYGEKILTQTRVYAKEYVGNGLNCTNCHLDKGRRAYSAPWVGVWGVFPEYRSRNAKVNLLEDRVNDCFERSMNGKALARDGDQMRAILAYMWWLSKDVVTGVDFPGRGFGTVNPERAPDRLRGQRIYASACAVCHGEAGQGRWGPTGDYNFPPLWGPQSFTIGAGMARLNTAAAFVKFNMPYGQGGTLGDQDAYDVAAYFTQQPGPDFPDKDKDWPKGDKPPDARY